MTGKSQPFEQATNYSSTEKSPVSALTAHEIAMSQQTSYQSQTPISAATEKMDASTAPATATSTYSSSSFTTDTTAPVANQPSTDKELAIPSSSDTAKVLANPLPRSHSDTAKEVLLPSHTDTHKQIVPQFPPMSMEKEVAVSTAGDGDKILTSTSSLSRYPTVTRANASLVLRVEKYNPFGLVLPMDQKLSLSRIDPITGREIGPMFVTGDMSWTDVVSVLPPMFELFAVTGGQAGGIEMRFVGRSVPRGWQGVSGVMVDVEYKPVEAPGQQETETESDKWEIDRRGLSRNYKFYRKTTGWGSGFVWKGTTGTVKDLVKEKEESTTANIGSKKEKVHRGNFKLVERKDGRNSGGEVLAVWQQARGSYLGDLTIFREAEGKIPVEIVVMTALTAVSAERASGLNWFAGIGK